jgi:YVTN family beta-propeller protein
MNISTLFSRPVVDGICGRSRPSSWALLIAFAIAALALWPAAGHAQKVTATVAVGAVPRMAAVNPVTNKTYVVNSNSNSVTVIDGATNATTTVNTGTSPFAAAVNPVTNKIYVPNFGSNTVTVIDGATNATTTLKAGQTPFAVAVNPVTDKIYVTNQGDGTNPSTVTVIDGATNTDATTTTVAVGIIPSDLVVNPVTDKIYVANSGGNTPLTAGNTVTVIDGTTNTPTTVIVGTRPFAVAVNPVTNKIYVADSGTVVVPGSTVTVIDGATNLTMPVTVGNFPVAVSVNPLTNTIYVANGGTPATPGTTVTVIDGATNLTTTLPAGIQPVAVGVNVATNRIYVANSGTTSTAGTTVTVIDGATSGTPASVNTTLTVGATPGAVGVNPLTNKIYVPNRGDPNSNSTVSVIDGATNVQAQPYTLTTAITHLSGDITSNPDQPFTFTATNTASPPVPPVTNLYFQFDSIDGPWSRATLTGPPMSGVFTFTGNASGLPANQHTLFAFAVDGQEATSVMLASSPIVGKVTSYVFGIPGPLDFAIGVAPGGSNSVKVTAGQAANYALQLTLKGFISPNDQLMVTVSCTGAPSNATCSGPGSPVTVTHAGPAALAISASTKANGMLIPSAPSSRLRAPWNRLPALLVLTMLLVFLLRRLLKRIEGHTFAPRLAFAAPILLLATTIVVMNGCGGGGSSSPPPPVNNGTPPGTYTLTVTGTTSGNLTHSQQLTLMVQ